MNPVSNPCNVFNFLRSSVVESVSDKFQSVGAKMAGIGANISNTGAYISNTGAYVRESLLYNLSSLATNVRTYIGGIESLHNPLFAAKAALENAKYNGVFKVCGNRIGNRAASFILRFVISIQTWIMGAKLNANFFRDYYTERLSKIYEKSNKARDNLQKELQDALSEVGIKLEGNTEASLRELLKCQISMRGANLTPQAGARVEGQIAALNKILGCESGGSNESIPGVLSKFSEIQNKEDEAIQALQDDLRFMVNGFLAEVKGPDVLSSDLVFNSILEDTSAQKTVKSLDAVLNVVQSFASKKAENIVLVEGFEAKFNKKVQDLTNNKVFTSKQVEELLADLKESRLSLSGFLDEKINILRGRINALSQDLYSNGEKTKLSSQVSCITTISQTVAKLIGGGMAKHVG